MDKKMYKVFVVDVCFDSYATDDVIVGAEGVDDLIQHIPVIFDDYSFTDDNKETFLKQLQHRIAVIEHLYTDTPYQILTSFAYYE